jgi:hypothetical protein
MSLRNFEMPRESAQGLWRKIAASLNANAAVPSAPAAVSTAKGVAVMKTKAKIALAIAGLLAAGGITAAIVLNSGNDGIPAVVGAPDNESRASMTPPAKSEADTSARTGLSETKTLEDDSGNSDLVFAVGTVALGDDTYPVALCISVKYDTGMLKVGSSVGQRAPIAMVGELQISDDNIMSISSLQGDSVTFIYISHDGEYSEFEILDTVLAGYSGKLDLVDETEYNRVMNSLTYAQAGE